MAQRRVSETLLGTTEASEILGMATTNVAKTLANDLTVVVLRPEAISGELPRAVQKKLQDTKVELLVDDKGRVRVQMLLIGEKAQRGYSRDWVEEVARQRAADPAARAVDAKRRAAARARAAA